ncbi:MAG TPA: protein phosphatase 2C domain-containing protein [Haliangium sp.]|nr:protein phosphatase 2C domain-containing protein [Haliangium sp.]
MTLTRDTRRALEPALAPARPSALAAPACPAAPAQDLDRAFAIAGGRVTGRAHQRLGQGCQDGLAWYAGADALVAVVTDGCGSSQYSEVGARLGARLLVAAIARELGLGRRRGPGPDAGSPDQPMAMSDAGIDAGLVQRACSDVRDHLRALARAMGGDLAHTVAEHFLFTLVGAVVTRARTLVFALGDGVVAINGAVHVIGPFPGNCPPYLGYRLLDPAADTALSFQATWPTPAIDSLLLATDGAGEILAHEGRALPGRDQPAGPLAQFWTDDACVRNPDAVRRRLWLMSREHVSPDWANRTLRRDPGILSDDTTLIAIRRRREAVP